MAGELLTGLGALGTGLGALGSIGTGLLNYSNSVTNLDYQKSLQQQIFNREDTALQRRMADAQAAGLNPYSVINSGGANSGNVVKTDAPQVQAMNFNGIIDTVKSILDIQREVTETNKAKIQAENEAKTGLILNADITSKDWQNKILGVQHNDYLLNNFVRQLDTERALIDFNYDFNRGVKMDGPFGTGRYGMSEFAGYGYDYNNMNPYTRYRNYDLLMAQQAADQSVYGTSYLAGELNYLNKFMIPYGEKQLEQIGTTNQLLKKENDWYNWNQGFNMASNIIDDVTGILFKKLDFGLKKAMNNSQINLNSSSSYRNYSQGWRNYYGR